MRYKARRTVQVLIALLLSVLFVGSAIPVAAETTGAPAAITLVPETTMIAASYVPMSLTGQVTDAQGNPVAGATVQIVSSNDSIGSISPSQVVTGADGSYMSTFTSETTVGSTTITAYVPGTSVSASATVTTTIVGAPYRVNMTADNLYPAAGSTVTITGRVTDINGSPESYVPVAFSAPAGSFAPSSVKTKVDGTFATSYTLPAEGGSFTITATVNAWCSGSLTLNAWSGNPAAITLVPETTVIGAMMVPMSLTGRVTDSQGVGMAGVPVLLSVTGSASVSPSQVTTAADGTYRATFTSGFMFGPAVVTAAVPGTTVSASVTVQQVMVGVPWNVTIAPADLFPMRGSTILVTGKVTDVNGNPNWNAPVTLSATNGSFASATAWTRADGSFKAYFTAPDEVRELTVTASLPWGDRSASVKLHVMPNDHPDHPAHP